MLVSQVDTAVLLPKAEKPSDALASREDLDSVRWQIRTVGQGGQPIPSSLEACPLLPDLLEEVSRNPFLYRPQMDSMSPIQGFEEEDGVFSLRGNWEPGKVLVQVSSPGFFRETRILGFPLEEGGLSIPLTPTRGLTLTVTDPQGSPLSGLEVLFAVSSTSTEVDAQAWEAALQEHFFQATIETDSMGVARLVSPPASQLTAQTRSRPGLSRAIVWGLPSEGESTLVVHPSFKLRGVVRAGGEGVSGATVSFLADQGSGTDVIGEAACDEEGRFQALGLSTQPKCLLALAHAPGYTSELQRVILPGPETARELAFQLEAAHEWDFLVTGPEGDPFPGAHVQFTEGPFSWIPYSYQSDEEGRFTSVANLAPGQHLLADFATDSFFLGRIQLSLPAEKSGVVRLSLPQLARLSSITVHGPLKGRTESEVVLRWPGGGESLWNPGKESPWVPSGRVALGLVMNEGSVYWTEAFLPPGDEVHLEVFPVLGSLRFSLPAPQEGPWSVTAEPFLGDSIDLGPLLAGPHEVSLSTGTWTLRCSGRQPPSLVAGPFVLDASPLDLGLLEPGTQGSLAGNIVDEGGRGWSGVEAEFVHGSGWVSMPEVSGPEGEFLFDGLPAGPGRVWIRPSRLQFLDCGDQSLPVVIPAGGHAEGVVFSLPLETCLVGSVAPLSGGKAFGLEGPRLERVELNGAGDFQIRALRSEGWVFVGASSPHGLEISGLHVPAGPRTVTMAPTSIQRDWALVDGLGGPLRSCKISLQASGGATLLSSSSGPEGGFSLSASGPVPLKLVVHFPNGKKGILSLDPLPPSGPLSVPEPEDARFKVVSVSGAPLGGVRVWREGAIGSWISTATGLVSIPLAPGDQGAIHAQKAGHWPLVEMARPGGEHILRRLASLEVSLPAGKAMVSLEIFPRFDAGGEEVPPPIPPQSISGAWILAGIPEGEYLLRALSSKGKALWEGEISLTGGETLRIDAE